MIKMSDTLAKHMNETWERLLSVLDISKEVIGDSILSVAQSQANVEGRRKLQWIQTPSLFDPESNISSKISIYFIFYIYFIF